MVCLGDLSWVCIDADCNLYLVTNGRVTFLGPFQNLLGWEEFCNWQATQLSGQGPSHPVNSTPVRTVPCPSSLDGSWSQILLSNSMRRSCRQYRRWVLTEGHHWRASGRFQTAPRRLETLNSRAGKRSTDCVILDYVGLISKGENR